MKTCNVRKELSIFISMVLVSMMLFSGMQMEKVYAASDAQVSYSVTYGQTEARGMLDQLNAWRTGQDAWYWNSDNTTKTTLNGAEPLQYDYGLERIAMKRAAELAISFSHTRPDGTDCFSAYDIGWNALGENIAAGQSSANSAFTSWKEENEPYSGQGHRRNMLNEGFGYIGIGHVVCNGVHYWVQEFNGISSEETDPGANDTTSKFTADIQASSMQGTIQISGAKSYSKIYAGDTVDFTKSFVGIFNGFTVTPVDIKLVWESDHPEIADVTEEGIVQTKSAGTVKIQATADFFGTELSESTTITISNKDTPKDDNATNADTSSKNETTTNTNNETTTNTNETTTTTTDSNNNSTDSQYTGNEYEDFDYSDTEYDDFDYDDTEYEDEESEDDDTEYEDADESVDNSDLNSDSALVGNEFGKQGFRYKITATNTVKLTGYTKRSTELQIPAKVEKGTKSYRVSEIDTAAFANNKSLTKVVIGQNIGEIGAKAFSGCTKLKTLVVKTGKLSKQGVKNSLKNSQITTITLRGAAKQKLAAYKKYFAKSNSGKKVKIKIG